MNTIEKLGLWDRFINMKGKYNIMYLENISTGFLGFDNAYKPFMLLYLSGSKQATRVYGGWYTHPGILSPLKSRYIIPGCLMVRHVG